MIKTEIQGDVFEAIRVRENPTVFMHGCNMQGKMGSGVAKIVRAQWPSVYTGYSSRIASGDYLLGHVLYEVSMMIRK